MKTLAILVLMFSVCSGAKAQELKSEHHKTLYAIGQKLGKDVADVALKKNELKYVILGLKDSVTGKPAKASLAAYETKIQILRDKRAGSLNDAFLKKAAARKGARRTRSGLVIRTLRKGKGQKPGPTDRVNVHYEGTLINGDTFDSSYRRGRPATFPLNRVIACWTEGVQMMRVGEKAELVCPPHIAYGSRGAPPSVPGGAVLTFKVELLGIPR